MAIAIAMAKMPVAAGITAVIGLCWSRLAQRDGAKNRSRSRLPESRRNPKLSTVPMQVPIQALALSRPDPTSWRARRRGPYTEGASEAGVRVGVRSVAGPVPPAKLRPK